MAEIRHNKEEKKFILKVDGEESKVEYEYKEGKMFLIHSEIPEKLRGKGIGKKLVLKTFEKLNEEGYKAVAVCPYIKHVKSKDAYWGKIIE